MADRDVLSEKELAEFMDVPTVLVSGEPYLWVLDFGWANVGYYVKHLSPTRILVAYASHFGNAGKDYGRLVTEGAGPNCDWRYEGKLIEINTVHVIKTLPYFGKVHRGGLVRA